MFSACLQFRAMYLVNEHSARCHRQKAQAATLAERLGADHQGGPFLWHGILSSTLWVSKLLMATAQPSFLRTTSAFRSLMPPSQQEDILTGLNLLRLLVQNRIAEFHTELELIPPQVDANDSPHFPEPVQNLSRCLIDQISCSTSWCSGGQGCLTQSVAYVTGAPSRLVMLHKA